MALVSRQLNPNRSSALDVFRGLTLAGMILVSTPGGSTSYAQLEHAAWDGWTFTDLVFPSFAFIIGVALTYSLASRRARTEWRGMSIFDWITPILLAIKSAIMLASPVPPTGGYIAFLAAILLALLVLPQLDRRATSRGGSASLQVIHHGFLVLALGFVWTFDVADPSGFRVLGVLQRLGIVYMVAGLIVIHTRRRGQIIWLATLLTGYWLLMKDVPTAGHAAGDLTMTGNVAGYVDRLVFGAAHLFDRQHGWDPEGLLGSIPAVATVLLGALAGDWLRGERTAGRRLSGLCLAGVALFAAGVALGSWFPINKNLWSPPYVLLVGGIDCAALAACVWLVDVKGVRKTVAPFLVLGSNSLLIYLLAGTVRHYAGEIAVGVPYAADFGVSAWDAAYHYGFASWLSPKNASVAMAATYLGLWTLIATALYRRRVFVKI